MNIQRSALSIILTGMEVPEMRTDTKRDANIRWLQRNLAINNSMHPDFWTAKELIRQILSNNA